MDEIKVVSFDVEGTLVTTDFSYAIWFEAIPGLYAQKKGVDIAQAKEIVMLEYEKIGDLSLEWYDVRQWLDRFDLGVPEPMMEGCQGKVRYYPEVHDVLDSLAGRYKLIATSGSPREFLRHLLRDIEPYFVQVFSSISDHKQLKTTDFYLSICRVMEVEPEQIVHIGDNRQSDYVTPNQVGIKAFYLDRNSGGCQDSLTSLAQLKSYLLA